eukprot:Em0021g185a
MKSAMKSLLKVLIYIIAAKESQPCATFGKYSTQAAPAVASGLFFNTSSVQCQGYATSWNVCYYASTTDKNGSLIDFGVYRPNSTSKLYRLVTGSNFSQFIPRSNASFSCMNYLLPGSSQYAVQPGDTIAVCVRSSQLVATGNSTLGVVASVPGTSVQQIAGSCTSLNDSINLAFAVHNMNMTLHVSLDVNECAVNNGRCEQNCTNNGTTYYCSCYNGILAGNGLNCTASTLGASTTRHTLLSLRVIPTSSAMIMKATMKASVLPTTFIIQSTGSSIAHLQTLPTSIVNTSSQTPTTASYAGNLIIEATVTSAAVIIIVIATICILVVVLVANKIRGKSKNISESTTTIGALDNIAYSGICTAPLDSKMEEDALTYEPINDNEQANSLAQSYEIPTLSLSAFSASYEELEGEAAYYAPASSEEGIYAQLDHQELKRISRSDIHITALLGGGQFGGVYVGMWNGSKGRSEVAIKMLNQSSVQPDARIKFLQEAAIMAQFRHPNIIELYGFVTDGESVMLVLELAHNKDLRSHLYKMRPDPGQIMQPDTPNILLAYSKQISLGMQYLSAKSFLHRDLAARNILVTKRFICKIADFGLSRDLADDTYYVSHGGMVPLKWTAPEAVHFMKYSTASDVWSYGCLLYEIWSIGCKPYEGLTNAEVIEKVDVGWRLAPPPGCPSVVYELMIQCWNPETHLRPSFRDIHLRLCQDENTLLRIPNEALLSSPQAGLLGAPLEAGEKMYLDLQKYYV